MIETRGCGQPASALIDEIIAELSDWRGEMLSKLRTVIKEAVPEVVEERGDRAGG
jgi:hypothetical protein